MNRGDLIKYLDVVHRYLEPSDSRAGYSYIEALPTGNSAGEVILVEDSKIVVFDISELYSYKIGDFVSFRDDLVIGKTYSGREYSSALVDIINRGPAVSFMVYSFDRNPKTYRLVAMYLSDNSQLVTKQISGIPERMLTNAITLRTNNNVAFERNSLILVTGRKHNIKIVIGISKDDHILYRDARPYTSNESDAYGWINTSDIISVLSADDVFSCEYCNRFELTKNVSELKNICKSCFEQFFVKCVHCGKIVRIGECAIDEDDHHVCDSCKPFYVRCQLCNKLVLPEKMHKKLENVYCSKCIQKVVVSKCVICGREHIPSSDRQLIYRGKREYVCRTCYSQRYSCRGCGNTHHRDELFQIGYNGETFLYCSTCVMTSSRDGGLQYCQACGSLYKGSACRCVTGLYHGHDYKPEPKFFPVESESLCYVGAEIEVEPQNTLDNYGAVKFDLITKLKTVPFIYFKSDGSLDSGCEIVSHPINKDTFLSMGWKNVFDTIAATKMDRNKNCGLHFHFSRKYFTPTMLTKLIAFFDLHWDTIYLISRRKPDDLNRWAAKYGLFSEMKDSKTNKDAFYCSKHSILFSRDDEVQDDKTNKLIRTLSSKDSLESFSRYYAINLQNEKTVEFRFFKGVVNLQDFGVSFRILKHLVEKSKDIPWNDVGKLEKWFEDAPKDVSDYLAYKGIHYE